MLFIGRLYLDFVVLMCFVDDIFGLDVEVIVFRVFEGVG